MFLGNFRVWVFIGCIGPLGFRAFRDSLRGSEDQCGV